MSAADLSRFDELVSHYLDDALTDPAAAELVALLAEPPLAARFLEMTRLNSEIAGLLAAPVPDAAMVELVRADIETHVAGAQPPRAAGLRILEREQTRTSVQTAASLTRPSRQRRPFSWQPLAWAAALAVFVGLAALFVANRTRLANAAVVAAVQGEVRGLGRKGERVLTAGQSWQRGETLRTVGPGSAGTVKLRDGSQLDFGANTVAVNESTQDGRRVGLEHGVMQAAVKKQPAGRRFIFTTPEAEAVVVGTKLRLVAGAHHTRLEVTEGEVRFRRRHDGSEIAVRAGQYALVAPTVPLVAKPLHGDSHHVP